MKWLLIPKRSNKDMSSRLSRLSAYTIYLAAAWSGCFTMGVELLGGRLLAPYFGTSIFVWGAIIFVFMSCLSIGYLLGGQYSTDNPSMTRLGFLLVGEAILTIHVPTTGGMIMEFLSYIVPDPRYGSLLGSILLFGPTTIVAGMISPYAVRLLISDLRESGKSAGFLYFVSTLGSAAGTILTSFYLVLYQEIDTIILTFITTSLVAGLALLAADRFGRDVTSSVRCRPVTGVD
jgi:hypothetical protein